jgi:hypothetical protein
MYVLKRMNGSAVLQSGTFIKGEGKVWMENVSCNGSEVSIANCTHNGWGVHSCDQTRTVGVICEVKGTSLMAMICNELHELQV